MEAGIGEIVSDFDQKCMNDFLKEHGEKAFISAVWNGAFSGVAFAYIHPADEMRTTLNFEIIQTAFINAYV